MVNNNFDKENKKGTSEIKEMLDALFKENPDNFEKMLKSEKISSGETNLVVSDVKIVQMNRDLVGNLFITDKNIYFITTKILNLPENLVAFYSGGILFGIVGEVINKLTNKPKTLQKTEDIPLNILVKYIDGSFKIELPNILLVRIDDKDSQFVFKTKNKNEWSHHFFAANSKDKEQIKSILNKNKIKIEPAKGFLKTFIEQYRSRKNKI